MWDLLGPGLEPVSPALAGRFLTTVPPGKPSLGVFKYASFHVVAGGSGGSGAFDPAPS